MATLVHIVHPHTYKMKKPDGLVLDPESNQENRVRDNLVGEYLCSLAATGVPMLMYHELSTSMVDSVLKVGALSMDSRFKPLLDLEKICTPRTGEPIPDVKPERVSQKVWDGISKVCVGQSAYLLRASRYDHHIFIGGMYEACVARAALFMKKHSDYTVEIVSNLCATWSEEEIAGCEKILLREGIKLTTYEGP